MIEIRAPATGVALSTTIPATRDEAAGEAPNKQGDQEIATKDRMKARERRFGNMGTLEAFYSAEEGTAAYPLPFGISEISPPS
jgi:hypothetical protein